MSEHLASIRWTRNGQPFDYEHYPRDHDVRFERGQRITGSAAPAYFGSADGVDPEEMLVAALSSCHMLTLLAIAAKKGFTIDAYEDDAVGTLGKNAEGRAAVTHVTLRPKITFAGDAPDAAALEKLHESAHRNC
ncbi:MAG: OsmC family peroxiredoxin, partial [Lysobacter sp.]|nr:OsmC family peroxiredoxin [Lysobacter sp.]